jgi:hypothetical protein
MTFGLAIYRVKREVGGSIPTRGGFYPEQIRLENLMEESDKLGRGFDSRPEQALFSVRSRNGWLSPIMS